MMIQRVLRNVFPRLATHNVEDRASVNPVLGGKFGVGRSGSVALPNLTHLIFGKGCHAMTFTASKTLRLGPSIVPIPTHERFGVNAGNMTLSGRCTTLRIAIRHVVGMSTEKKVIRPHAQRIVTVMADQDAFGNWSVGYLPCKTMCGHKTLAIEEQAIPSALAGCPYPTIGGLSNFRPKQINA